MANFMDRQTTLTRLSKLQQEIQKLTDSLTSPKSSSTSSKYESKATSEPTPRYTSELEAKYLGKAYDSSKFSSTGRRPSKSSGVNQSWRDNRSPRNLDDRSNLASRSATYSAESFHGNGHKSFTFNRSSYTGREYKQYPAAKPSRHDSYSRSESHGESYLGGRQKVPPSKRSLSHSSVEYLSSARRLKEIEDKYLKHAPGLSTWQTAQSSNSAALRSLLPMPSLSTCTSVPWSRSRSYPSPKDSSHRSGYLVGSSSPSLSLSSKGKSSKYSWRPSTHAPRSQTSPASRSHSSGRSSTSSRHHSSNTHGSKYRSESSKMTSSSSRRHGHDPDRHSSRYSYTSAASTARPSSTHSSSYSTFRSMPQVKPSSSVRRSTHHTSAPARSHGFSSHRGPGYISSRGRGFRSSRGRGSPRGRGFAYRASRGAVTFRGRGARGYRPFAFRSRSSGRSRGRGFYRGQSSFGYRSGTASAWRVPHRSSYNRKATSMSPKKLSTSRSFSSRYALRRSLGISARDKPLSFMERRRQTVLSNTPVPLRSKYNLVKGHRSVVRPVSSLMSLARTVRKTSDVKRLVTVKNTKTKLIRRAEGERRPSGSLVNLGGSQFKLRINRYSKVLYRIPSGTHAAPSGSPMSTPRSTPSTSKKTAETPRHTSNQGRKLMLKSSTPSVTRKVASHVLQRSIYISLTAKQRTKKQSQMKQYCMFYNLYGRCKRGDACPYIHDPEKVAVCTRFLRGTCPKTDGSCLFSHKVSKEKMPVCSYFLRGICNRDDCPYSHVKVSSKAIPCSAFIKGYCPLGEKCKKQHVLRCVRFSKTGKCDKGKDCPLLHKKDAVNSSKSRTKAKMATKRSGQMDKTDTRTPAKKVKRADESTNTPSFIKLSSNSPPEKTASSESKTGEATANKAEAMEGTSSLTSGEVGGIIPSFIKLSSVERAKAASTSGASKRVGDTKAEDDSTNLSRMRTSSNDLPPVGAAPFSQSDYLELFDDTPISHHSSQDGPVTSPSAVSTCTLTPTKHTFSSKEEVTAPSPSSEGVGSSTSFPSFIELSTCDTPLIRWRSPQTPNSKNEGEA
ncbi:uncharacterized protein LOC110975684 isoform X2 [Acanthaster planci]|uniref:Zinc finger CCCH domain-containing protein 3 n=1 Tax=Acanthaster planci TaxID=133434 RepID=A0A8B7XW42_ACAPL|nr:uncharacterized protein LOC110975684 isoform X2 [Acanthaster planci]